MGQGFGSGAWAGGGAGRRRKADPGVVLHQNSFGAGSVGKADGGSSVLAVLCRLPGHAAGPRWGTGSRTAHRRCITLNMRGLQRMTFHVRPAGACGALAGFPE